MNDINPFDILKAVVRGETTNKRMIFSNMSVYIATFDMLNKAKNELNTIRVCKNIDFNIRVKSLLTIYDKYFISSWFKYDRLKEVNIVLSQFDTIVENFLDSNNVISTDIEYIKNTKNKYVEWAHTHKDNIGLSHFVHTYYKPAIKYNENTKYKLSEHSDVDILVEDFLLVIEKALKEIETINIMFNQKTLESSQHESTLHRLQSKLMEMGVNWK